MAFGERIEGLRGVDAFRHTIDNHKYWDYEKELWVCEYTVTQKVRYIGSPNWDDDDSFTIRMESEDSVSLSNAIASEVEAHLLNIDWDISGDDSPFRN